jgi:hypothetical protein
LYLNLFMYALRNGSNTSAKDENCNVRRINFQCTLQQHSTLLKNFFVTT